jgi:hypothetical protein
VFLRQAAANWWRPGVWRSSALPTPPAAGRHKHEGQRALPSNGFASSRLDSSGRGTFGRIGPSILPVEVLALESDSRFFQFGPSTPERRRVSLQSRVLTLLSWVSRRQRNVALSRRWGPVRKSSRFFELEQAFFLGEEVSARLEAAPFAGYPPPLAKKQPPTLLHPAPAGDRRGLHRRPRVPILRPR